ncbi:MAG: hypothetical protein LH469_05075 [Frankiaceae bacterium]|nr:hypothetical protein [Frankiaceae bacterium]
MKHGRLIAAATTGLVGGSLLLGIPAASAAPGMDKPNKPGKADKTVSLQASLSELNFSGASGSATATVKNQKIENISISATGLAPDAAHAIHIHFGEKARHECPTMGRDAKSSRSDGTSRLSTADGLKAYGPIVVSLTTTGDTTPASGLALNRFPTSKGGGLSYNRSKIEFTDVAGVGTAKSIADGVRAGEGVLVVHGNDYNKNGAYDFEAAGKSELDPSLPAEGTDPTACGVLAVR